MKNIFSLSVLAGLATAYTGDLTYYSAGVGSCGFTSTDGDAIVALSLPMVNKTIILFPQIYSRVSATSC